MIFHWQEQIGLMLCSLVLSGTVARKSRAAGIALFIFSALAITTASPTKEIPHWLQGAGAQSLIVLMAISASAALCPRRWLDVVLEGIAWVEILTSIFVFGRWYGDLDSYAWMNSQSADAALVASLYPVLIFRNNKYQPTDLHWRCIIVGLPIIAVVVNGSSTGLAAILVVLAAQLLRQNLRMAAAIGAALALTAAIGASLLRHNFLADSGRREVWTMALRYQFSEKPAFSLSAPNVAGSAGIFANRITKPMLIDGKPFMMANASTEPVEWWKQKHVWLGIGSGSFPILFPAVERDNGYNDEGTFTNAHNEFIQILWDQGILGLIAFLAFGISTLWASYRKPWLFSALLGYSVSLFTQYPLRGFLSAFVGAILVRESWE